MKKEQKSLKRKRVFTNPAYKDKATVLRSSEETNGKYSLGELEVAPGGGNPLHVHSAFTETFIPIKGRLGVMLRNKKLYLEPGQSLTIPLNTPHHFFNDGSEVITCHIKLEPGHDGFEKGIAIAYGLATDGLVKKNGVPKNFTHLALIIYLTNTRPVGALGLLMPLITLVAKRARKKGIEQALLEKYYYEES
jgi:mannose-6-phosphate isomerase-like protein (cupin superfamily)